MSISFSCPHCQRQITVADKFAGQRGRCPGCSNPVAVPAAQAGAIDPLPSIEPPSPVILPSANLVPASVTVPATASMPVLDPQSEVSHYLDDDHDDDEEGGHRSHSLLQHKDKPHEDLIDMTPMVDIVFFLLIFFLTTTLTAVTAVMNLPKPEKATEGGGASKSVSDLAEDKDTLMVKIQEDDTFWIEDEQFFSDQDLRIRIRTAVAESAGKPLALIVVGNSDASYGAAIRAIDAGADAKVGSVSLLVKDDTGD